MTCLLCPKHKNVHETKGLRLNQFLEDTSTLYFSWSKIPSGFQLIGTRVSAQEIFRDSGHRFAEPAVPTWAVPSAEEPTGIIYAPAFKNSQWADMFSLEAKSTTWTVTLIGLPHYP